MQGVRQCQQLFELNAFNYLVKFLLGFDPADDQQNNNNNDDPPAERAPGSCSPPPVAAPAAVDIENKQRMWSTTQSREFGELHSALSHLILACDTTAARSEGKNVFR